jgi:hypothetical protein
LGGRVVRVTIGRCMSGRINDRRDSGIWR